MAFVNLNPNPVQNTPLSRVDPSEVNSSNFRPKGFVETVTGKTPSKRRQEEEVYIRGTVKWCKHLAPDFQFDPVGKWSVVIYLVGEELEKARELQAQGIKNTIKKDDDGWYMTLSRKCSYQVRGQHVGREPPKVFQSIDGINIPCTSPIGNGSSGTAKCILWSSPNFPGKNLRWEELRVDNLIPYTAATAYPDGGESLKSFEDKPPEVWH